MDDTYGFDKGCRYYEDYSPTLRSERIGLKVMSDTYRIRKLTPKECMRLMGFSEEDYNAVSKEFSDSAIYHVSGDSIIVTCLMGLFGTMLDIDYRQKINDYVETLRGDYE